MANDPSALRLETQRLWLRPPSLADFEPWADLQSDELATRHIGGLQPRPVAFRGLLAMAGAWSLQGFGMFSVIEKASGRWLGRVGPWSPEGWPGTEVGWTLARDAWGQGYATEAATRAIDWAFANLGWTEVIHTIAPANEPSKSVARRLGSSLLRMGRLPAPFDEQEIEVWGQGRDQWRLRSEVGASGC